MRALIVAGGVLIALAGCRSAPVPARAEIANSEAVRALRADSSPYRIIYYQAEDLAKKPAPATTGPASPRRE